MSARASSLSEKTDFIKTAAESSGRFRLPDGEINQA
jgi:hypothetical protein